MYNTSILSYPSESVKIPALHTILHILHHVITIVQFSGEVEVDEAKNYGFIGLLRNTGPVQIKVLPWLIVTRCDKMWQDAISSGCSCKMPVESYRIL